MKLNSFSLTLFFIFSINTILLAQQGANDINPENMAGVIMYDADEAIKKIKIKKDPKKIIFKRSLSTYNNKINEIKTFNYLVFKDVKSFIIKKTNEVKLTKDYRSMKDARLKIQEMLDPIRSKIQVQDSILNTSLEKELTAKEYKNWTKYKKNQLKKLQPKAPPRPQRQYRPRTQRNGYGRGMNRGYY